MLQLEKTTRLGWTGMLSNDRRQYVLLEFGFSSVSPSDWQPIYISRQTWKYTCKNLLCRYMYVCIHSFIYSFKDLYSTSSRKLLRGAPDSSTVKKQFSIDYRMCLKGRRRSAGGRLFHTVGAKTEQPRLCMIVVRANRTESRERLLREPDTGRQRSIR